MSTTGGGIHKASVQITHPDSGNAVDIAISDLQRMVDLLDVGDPLRVLLDSFLANIPAP